MRSGFAPGRTLLLLAIWSARAGADAPVDLFSTEPLPSPARQEKVVDLLREDWSPPPPEAEEERPPPSPRPEQPPPEEEAPGAITVSAEAVEAALELCRRLPRDPEQRAAHPECLLVERLPPPVEEGAGTPPREVLALALRTREHLRHATRRVEEAVSRHPELDPSPEDDKTTRRRGCAPPPPRNDLLQPVIRLRYVPLPPVEPPLDFHPQLPNGEVSPVWRGRAESFLATLSAFLGQRAGDWETLTGRLTDQEARSRAMAFGNDYRLLELRSRHLLSMVWSDVHTLLGVHVEITNLWLDLQLLELNGGLLLERLEEDALHGEVPSSDWWESMDRAFEIRCDRLWKEISDYLDWLSLDKEWQRRAAARLLTPALTLWGHCSSFRIDAALGLSWSAIPRGRLPAGTLAHLRSLADLLPRRLRWLEQEEARLAAGGVAFLARQAGLEKKEDRASSGSSGKNLRQALGNMGGWAQQQLETFLSLRRWEQALAKEAARNPKLEPLLADLRGILAEKAKRLALYPVVFRRGMDLLPDAEKCEHLEACYSRVMGSLKGQGLSPLRKWRAAVDTCGAHRPYCREIRWFKRFGAFRGALGKLEMEDAWTDTSDLPLLLARIQKALGLERPPEADPCFGRY